MTDPSRSRSSISSPLPLSPVKSTRGCISSIGAAANSPVLPPSSSDVPVEASPSPSHLPSTRPVSPARPSYAAMASRSPSTLRTPTPKDQRPLFPKPLSSSSPQPTKAAINSVRAISPYQSSSSSSPVLSIHNLERRFRNRLSPIQDRYSPAVPTKASQRYRRTTLGCCCGSSWILRHKRCPQHLSLFRSQLTTLRTLVP
jgi:hypothetical protein